LGLLAIKMVLYPENQTPERGKISVPGPHRRRSLWGHMRTYEQPGEGCDEQRFTKSRYRKLLTSLAVFPIFLGMQLLCQKR